MLRLDNIVKDYQMKGNNVRALDHLSLCFRNNEFVSVLGPSGCGKTTLLNILGGLDHYSEGDLIIEGKSTKNYTDHDWDIYRNHKIGFIFQSYNLIPHQNILENVELALIISGVSKTERTQRAKAALDEVGLKDLYKKMPNQLSGGQCQRVAIARALVNEPEILLADEPTGALDSLTSIQIMELIEKIAKKRLVIMVTHNPDLAQKYSTRIIKLLDGKLVSDSMPFSKEDEKKQVEIDSAKEKAIDTINSYNMVTLPKLDKSSEAETDYDRIKQRVEENQNLVYSLISVPEINEVENKFVKSMEEYNIDVKEVEKSNAEKKDSAKMGALTSFKLSGKNLLSKLKRTILTVFGSSIGIIGVSAVLAVSSGVQGYIKSMQDDMLSGNPLSIAQESFDLSKLMKSFSPSEKQDMVQQATKEGYIDVNFITKTLINSANAMGNSMISNKLTLDYVNYLDSIPEEAYSAMAKYYGIQVSNNIFTKTQARLNHSTGDATLSLSAIPNVAASVVEQSEHKEYAKFIPQVAETIAQSIDNEDYILDQYDVVKGKMAKGEDELMLVLNKDGKISDMTLAMMGVYGQDEFLNLIHTFTNDGKGNAETFEKIKQISIDDIMKKEFYYYPNDVVFEKDFDEITQTYNNPNKPFKYHFQKETTWKDSDGMVMKFVGVLQPKKDRQYVSLSNGFYYTPAFTERFLKDNLNSNISQFLNDYCIAHPNGFPTMVSNGTEPISGIYYSYEASYEDDNVWKKCYTTLGSSSMFDNFSSSDLKITVLEPKHVGASNIPTQIDFYPNSFEKKYMITDYLDKWNSEEDITVNGKVLKKADREEVDYSDNLELIINMISTMIDIVTVALVCFTALSLVVSVVMIAIITYVSVMERIKEIGIIRALGGRKRDVSRLFNVETIIIGASSGLFGILVTYILEIIINVVIHANFPMITMIANLSPVTALIVVAISILLTTIAGLVPAKSAAKKDPVVALRTE